jgi:hypothetical protein
VNRIDGVKKKPAALYDLKNDIGEATDLAAKEPAKELKSAYDAWNAGNIPPRWVPFAKEK